MANKFYFEMSQEERAYNHIAHDLDYAVTTLAEGFATSCIKSGSAMQKKVETLIDALEKASELNNELLEYVTEYYEDDGYV